MVDMPSNLTKERNSIQQNVFIEKLLKQGS